MTPARSAIARTAVDATSFAFRKGEASTRSGRVWGPAEKLKTREYQFCAVGIDKELDQVVGEAAIRCSQISPEVEAFYTNRIVKHTQEGA